ncbi:hypothetical protein PG997_002591 [Apiospora hydei]|uniref:Secreted protein n=1 Tax=Apiospora hydei TaxID=1337664 RepID=A0ABR1WWW6_9PEZI
MRSSAVLSIVALTSSALASVVQPRVDHSMDGVYNTKGRIGGDKRSVDDAVDVVETVANNGTDHPVLQARKWTTTCHEKHGHKVMLYGPFVRDAMDEVKRVCAAYPDSCRQETVWSIKGDVVAYFCYWGGKDVYNPTNFDNAWNGVQKSCGKVNLAGEIGEDSSAYGVTNHEQFGWCGFPVNYKLPAAK